MIWMALGVGLLIILLGAPALVDPIRKATARREAAAAARAADEAQRKRDALAAQQQAELLWNNSPDRAGLREYLRYIAKMKMPLEHDVNERQRRYDQRGEQVKQHLSGYRDNKIPSAAYRLLVLIGLIFFLAVFGLGITLDYLIFRGLHPSGSMALPFGLACLAVLGITIGSVMMFGAARHHLLPHTATPYFRRVVMVGGAMLAVGVASYMAVIAPNRSYPAGAAKISTAEQVLHADQSAQPPVGQQVIALDQAAVAQARADLARAQQVDRLSAAALAFIEIPLSEAAVLGGELLILYLAIFRRERARQQHQQATDALQQANARFMAELTQVLVAHGHDEEAVRRILSRFARMNAPVSGQLTSNGTAAAPGPAGLPGGGGNPGGTPGAPPGGPAGSATGGGSAAPGAPGLPTQGNPGASPPGGTPANPAITIIPPAGPAAGAGPAPSGGTSQGPLSGVPTAVPTAAPAGMTPAAGLSAAEFDETD